MDFGRRQRLLMNLGYSVTNAYTCVVVFFLPFQGNPFLGVEYFTFVPFFCSVTFKTRELFFSVAQHVPTFSARGHYFFFVPLIIKRGLTTGPVNFFFFVCSTRDYFFFFSPRSCFLSLG